MAEKDEIIAILKNFGEYYDKPLSSNVVRLYVTALQDIRSPILEQAAQIHIKESSYFPLITELRKLASRVKFEMDYLQPDDSDYWQAMAALKAYFHGELSQSDLYRQHASTLINSFARFEDDRVRQACILAELKECPVCHSSGFANDDPDNHDLCPDCSGQGYIRSALENENHDPAASTH